MRKLVKVMVCVALIGSVFWTATPSKQQNADFMGPGPMNIGKLVANYTGPGPMSIQVDETKVAVHETPGPQGIVVYKG